MAIGTLPARVPSWADMAGFAIGITCMIEYHFVPVGSVVATGTLSRPVAIHREVTT